jgi:hypothetical protein
MGTRLDNQCKMAKWQNGKPNGKPTEDPMPRKVVASVAATAAATATAAPKKSDATAACSLNFRRSPNVLRCHEHNIRMGLINQAESVTTTVDPRATEARLATLSRLCGECVPLIKRNIPSSLYVIYHISRVAILDHCLPSRRLTRVLVLFLATPKEPLRALLR